MRLGLGLRLCVMVRTHQLAFKYFSNLPNHFLISKYFLEGKSFPKNKPVDLAPRTSSHQLIKCSYRRGLIISFYPSLVAGWRPESEDYNHALEGFLQLRNCSKFTSDLAFT